MFTVASLVSSAITPLIFALMSAQMILIIMETLILVDVFFGVPKDPGLKMTPGNVLNSAPISNMRII